MSPTAHRSNPANAQAQDTHAQDTQLRLDVQLCFALYASSLAVTKAYKPLLGPLGLTYPQYLVMLVLWEHDGIHVSQLGDRLSLDSGTLTPLLKRMEIKGWLHRERAVTDERRVDVFLTQQGQQLKSKARGIPRQLLSKVDCSLTEIQTLAQRLHRLRRDLQSKSDTSLAHPTPSSPSPLVDPCT